MATTPPDRVDAGLLNGAEAPTRSDGVGNRNRHEAISNPLIPLVRALARRAAAEALARVLQQPNSEYPR